MYNLDNWKLVKQFSFNEKNPEVMDEVLIMSGQLDGEWVLTDPILVLDAVHMVVTTKGRKSYKLGKSQ
jgi:hypothetical protein